MLTLERIALDNCDWLAMDALPDRVVFQTREWLEFVARTQGAEPVVAELRDGRSRVGWFTGLIVRRFGVRVLGSPFPGWTTGSMGFNLTADVPRREAVRALVRFAFDDLRCLHMELKDRWLIPDDVAGLQFSADSTVLLEIALDRDEEAIFDGMSSACRRAIRRSAKVGLQVEQAHGIGFADEYYAQLADVFAKQGLRPTYGVERVRELIRCLEPTGRLLLVRAVGPDGRPAATGIFPAMNGTAYFWGGASWRSEQLLRPNEAVFWYAMRHWRERGMLRLDMGGGGDYKRKYGPTESSVPFFRRSRFPGLQSLRRIARAAVALRQRAHIRSR